MIGILCLVRKTKHILHFAIQLKLFFFVYLYYLMNCSQIGGIVGLVEMFIELVRIDGNYQNLGTPSIYL